MSFTIALAIVVRSFTAPTRTKHLGLGNRRAAAYFSGIMLAEEQVSRRVRYRTSWRSSFNAWIIALVNSWLVGPLAVKDMNSWLFPVGLACYIREIEYFWCKNLLWLSLHTRQFPSEESCTIFRISSSFGKTFLCRVSSHFSNAVSCSFSSKFCMIISSDSFTPKEGNNKICCCVSSAILIHPSAVCVSWTNNRKSKYNFRLLSRIATLFKRLLPAMPTLNIVTFWHYLNQFGYESVIWINL